MPSHLAVLRAVSDLQDEELERWTRRRDSYLLTPEPDLTDALGLPDRRLWRLQPADASAPVAVRLVERQGRLEVLTGRPRQVADLLLDAAPPDDALPALLCALWGDPHPGLTPVPGTASILRAGDHLGIRLLARDRWSLHRCEARLSRADATVHTAPEDAP